MFATALSHVLVAQGSAIIDLFIKKKEGRIRGLRIEW